MHADDTDIDTPPQIRVDADACPVVIRDILFRAAQRAQVHVTFVASQRLRMPGSRYLRALQVSVGYDVADDAIDPRGQRFTPDNIAECLSMRNFMDELRGRRRADWRSRCPACA